MNKTLVTYFSASGVTKELAKRIAQTGNFDLFEIEPKVPYTPKDLNWMDKNSRSSVEMKNPLSRPVISSKVENMEQYSTVFVGFPIWWYVAPTIINTFLESYDFSNKTVVVYATAGSSGFGKTVEVLKELCGDSTKWIKGKVFTKIPSETELQEWLNALQA